MTTTPHGDATRDAGLHQPDTAPAQTASDPTAFRFRRTRCVLAVLAVIGVLPYLSLKVSWLAGGRAGLNDPTFGTSTTMHVANTATAGLDAIAVLMAIVLCTRWGRRVPAWLVGLPMWVGTGLLAPIVIVVPLQALLGAPATPDGAPGPVAGWVYTLVYAGFVWQGLTLLSAFVLYAIDRWSGPRGFRRPLHELPARRELGHRPDAGTAVVLTVLVAAAIALAGLLSDASSRDPANLTGFALVTVLPFAALLAITLGRPRRLPVWAVTVAVWLGSGALVCWATYGLVLLITPNDLMQHAVTPVAIAGQAARIVAGLIAAGLGARLLGSRAAGVSAGR